MIKEDDLRTHHELYSKIQNDYRQMILSFCYQESRSYSELIEETGLKPGSLYHHLGILDPLVVKSGHGQYSITPLGREIAEEFDLITDTKPSIDKEDTDEIQEEVDQQDEKSVTTLINPETILEQIWLFWPSYIIVILTLGIVIWLATYGVALAGSAIYAVGDSAFIFDLTAILLGLLVLYSIESILFRFHPQNRIRFTLTIRIISMVPATVVGIALLILYIQGIIIPASIFPWLFAITITLGTLIAASGIQYLRGITFSDAITWASLVSGIDLLLGIVVLIVQ